MRRFNPSSIRSGVPSGRQHGHSNGRNRTSRGTSDLRPTGARYLFGRGAPSHTCLGTFSRVKPCAPLLPRASDASCSWLDVVWSCVDTRCRVADRGASAAGGDAGDRILGFGSLDNFGRYLTAFRKGLNEAGFVEGRNVANSPCSMIALRAGAGKPPHPSPLTTKELLRRWQTEQTQ